MWTRVFETTTNTEAETECNLPGQPKITSTVGGQAETQSTPFGTMLPRDALDHVTPVAPQDVSVQVLNGNGQSRQATLISEELTGYGFSQGALPSNDPAYPQFDLKCNGEIRFGPAGVGAARTLSLAVPCAQLVRDNSPGSGVKLSLGSEFNDIAMTSQARQVLQQLRNWASQQAQETDAQSPPAPTPPPQINSDLLAAARDVHC
jgi:hypothetical protein